MSEMSPAEFEGRLAAQREMIASLAARITALEAGLGAAGRIGRFQREIPTPSRVRGLRSRRRRAGNISAVLEAARAITEGLVEKRKARPVGRAFVIICRQYVVPRPRRSGPSL